MLGLCCFIYQSPGRIPVPCLIHLFTKIIKFSSISKHCCNSFWTWFVGALTQSPAGFRRFCAQIRWIHDMCSMVPTNSFQIRDLTCVTFVVFCIWLPPNHRNFWFVVACCRLIIVQHCHTRAAQSFRCKTLVQDGMKIELFEVFQLEWLCKFTLVFRFGSIKAAHVTQDARLFGTTFQFGFHCLQGTLLCSRSRLKWAKNEKICCVFIGSKNKRK